MKWHFIRNGSSAQTRLVWFHGFMGSSKDWQETYAPQFEDYENIFLDLPGHGQTDLDDTPTVKNLFDSLQGQLIEMAPRETIFIGYSMGGRVALHFQQCFPGLCSGFIGLSCTPGLQSASEREHRQKQDALLMDKLKEIGPQRFLSEWYQLPLFHTLRDRPELRSKLIKNRSKNDPDLLGKSLSLLGNGALPNIWLDLDRITSPVLLGCGGEDKKYMEINKARTGIIPHAERFVIDGCSHAFHLEKPLETIQTMRHFLGTRFKGDSRVSN